MDEQLKDPAVSWYFGNYYSSTRMMSQAERGAYMDVLSMLFENGRLTKEQVIRACEGHEYPEVFRKLRVDENGLYYNLRLEKEIEKRKKSYTSKFKNLGNFITNPPLKGKGKKKKPEKEKLPPPPDASTPGEGNIPKTRSRKPVIFKPPTLTEVQSYFVEHGFDLSVAKRAFEGYEVNNWVDTKGNEIKNWKLKMQQVWFTEEHKVKSGVKELGQRVGQAFVSGQVPASFKKN